MDEHDEHIETNRRLWDAWVPGHLESAFYDVDSFKTGRCTLVPFEIEEVDDVTGKTLLHLQCHFGLDTLSWARRGAVVTGVDFSRPAVDTANALAAELGLPAAFVCSNIYDAPASVGGQFDVVYTSWGALGWLPDTRRWAEVVGHFVAEGGVFYIAEFHPLLTAAHESELRPEWRYFRNAEPYVFDEISYTDRGAAEPMPGAEWQHPIGDVITALIDAGLTIEFLHERAESPFRLREFMVQDDDGWWRVPGEVWPATYSLRATKQH